MTFHSTQILASPKQPSRYSGQLQKGSTEFLHDGNFKTELNVIETTNIRMRPTWRTFVLTLFSFFGQFSFEFHVDIDYYHVKPCSLKDQTLRMVIRDCQDATRDFFLILLNMTATECRGFEKIG